MASKYTPLQQHLREAQGQRVRLAFDQIEAIVGFELPRSA